MSYLGASCGYWTLAELSRSHGRHATSRTRRQTRYWVRTTESEQSVASWVCNRPKMKEQNRKCATFEFSHRTTMVERAMISHALPCNFYLQRYSHC